MIPLGSESWGAGQLGTTLVEYCGPHYGPRGWPGLSSCTWSSLASIFLGHMAPQSYVWSMSHSRLFPCVLFQLLLPRMSFCGGSTAKNKQIDLKNWDIKKKQQLILINDHEPLWKWGMCSPLVPSREVTHPSSPRGKRLAGMQFVHLLTQGHCFTFCLVTRCTQRLRWKGSEALETEMELGFCIRRIYWNQSRCHCHPAGSQAIDTCILEKTLTNRSTAGHTLIDRLTQETVGCSWRGC